MATRQLPATINQDWFTTNIGTPQSSDELIALEPLLAEWGIRVSRNAAGRAGKIILPNENYLDIIYGSNSEDSHFQFPSGDIATTGPIDGAPPATPPPGRTAPPGSATGEKAVPRYAAPGYGASQGALAAQLAAMRRRKQSGSGGRASTVLGGFGGSRQPQTRPAATLLGS